MNFLVVLNLICSPDNVSIPIWAVAFLNILFTPPAIPSIIPSSDPPSTAPEMISFKFGITSKTPVTGGITNVAKKLPKSPRIEP